MSSFSMTSDQKKTFLLLKMVIFNYHGLDMEEKRILKETAEKLNALPELDWAYEMIGTDYYASHNKVKEYFAETIALYDKTMKIDFLKMVWESTVTKGYISEMEATGMLRFAKEWGVQKELLEIIRK